MTLIKKIFILAIMSFLIFSCSPSAKSLADQFETAFKNANYDRMDEITDKAEELGVYREFEREVQQKRLW